MSTKPTSRIFKSKLIGYYTIFAAFWIFAASLVFTYGYQDSFLRLNSFRFGLLDMIMPHFTHLGEALILTAIFSFFITPKDKPLVMTTILGLLTLMVVIYFLKQVIFPGWGRPMVRFDDLDIVFHNISLRDVRSYSFPSGHAAAAACMNMFIAFYLVNFNKVWGWILAILAILIAFSRVYIGVHFLGDILAGSMIGFGIAWIYLRFVYPKWKKVFSRMSETKHKTYNLVLRGFFLVALVFGIIRLINTYYFPGMFS